MTGEFLALFWETVREYIPAKDRQIAADHIVNELVDFGLDDQDLHMLACDRIMKNSIQEHIEVDSQDDDEEE